MKSKLGAALFALVLFLPLSASADPGSTASQGARAGQSRPMAVSAGSQAVTTKGKAQNKTKGKAQNKAKGKAKPAVRAAKKLAKLRRDGTETLTAGGEHGCTISGGVLSCWGRNSWGQIGAGKYGDQTTTALQVGTGNLWKSVSGGGASTCAIRTNGRLFCWGVNNKGQIGVTQRDPSRTPAMVTGSRRWSQVSAGWFTTCGIDVKTRLFCWGDNAGGQFGKTGLKTSSTPIKVPGSGFAAVSTGMSRFVCAIKTDGSLWCWGGNLFGQLGLGDQPNRIKPTRVGVANNWVKVSTSWSHTCALNSGGQVWCWGRNNWGQVGLAPDPAAPVSSVPVLVPADVPATDVATTEGASCLLGQDGQTRCWGNNAYGIVGDPAVPYTATPTPVGPAGLTAIDGGWRHMCGADAAGTPTCWGENDRAQLGNGTTTSTTAPIEVQPAPVEVAGQATPLRLATINALGNGHTRPYAPDDHYAPTTTRSTWLADALAVNRIDVAGLQEMGSDQLAHLLKASRGTYAAYPGPEAGDLGVEATIVWRTSVWEAVETSSVTTQFISRSLPRPIVKLRHRGTGQEIYVMNVHNAPWDYQRKRDLATDVQIPKLAELRATGLPVFYVGDFNEWRNILCKTTTGTDLVSPYGGGYNAATGTCANPPGKMRVDWIFGPPTATYSGFSYFRDALLSLVTDHNAAMVDVSMPPAAPVA